MKVLLDINIWLDVAVRPKTHPLSVKLFRHLEQRGYIICMPLSGYTTVYYLLSQLITKEGALEFLHTLKKRGVRFLPFAEEEITIACKLSFSDYEDACVAATAFNSNCDYIVTRSEKDYKKSPIKAVTPKIAINKGIFRQL